MKVFIIAALLAVAAAAPLEQEAGPSVADQPQNTNVQAPGPVDPAPAAAAANAAVAAAAAAAAPSANEATLNEENARRQHSVNYQALHNGAGVGTAPYYGVPGTAVKGQVNSGVYNNGAYGYNAGYGHRGAYNGYHGTYNGPVYGHGLHHAGHFGAPY